MNLPVRRGRRSPPFELPPFPSVTKAMSHPSFAAGPDSGGPTGPAAPAAIRPGQNGHPVLAPLLDLDPDLGRGLSPALRAQARPWLVVRLEPMRRGV